MVNHMHLTTIKQGATAFLPHCSWREENLSDSRMKQKSDCTPLLVYTLPSTSEVGLMGLSSQKLAHQKALSRSFYSRRVLNFRDRVSIKYRVHAQVRSSRPNLLRELERLLTEHQRAHQVDDPRVGAGRVWRPTAGCSSMRDTGSYARRGGPSANAGNPWTGMAFRPKADLWPLR